MFPVVFFVIAVIAAALRVALTKKELSGYEKAGIFLLYIIVMNIGLSGLYSFMGHAFIPDKIAAEIGWPAGSPFQFEVAIANLSFGVLGVLSIFIRGKFWAAVVIGNCVFLWGAAYGHFVQLAKGDHSPYNSGIFLYAGDIFIPLITFILMVMYYRKQKKYVQIENN
ncbi:MAG TPA: hypothetical protein PK605_06085 [Ignavibacteria bacterium]|nr:hypothetical protein [Bacteroidota bacterium]HRE10201.1 hypothetical protein [Ignavibacteria bacterium]HRF65347.1 hypothetical protein [Ignavibacteria bacterium]HRJ03955.1 hypothetical protein [Ignavibacteria bacterium]HRJ86423.1 hypothetical protein [Ignavibacteria bacterium]